MDNAAKAFNEYANEYDRWFDSPEGRVLFEMEADAVRLLMSGIKKPFLEIGVGTGRFAKELGIEFGVDPSPKLLEMALKRGIKIRKAKGEKLPFKYESFGGVFILFTLCFVKDAGAVIAEAKRVLKPGGGMIIGIINRESPWGRFYLQKKEEGHPIYKHARFYSTDETVRMLRNAGFSIKAYSSTLCQPPADMPYKETVYNELIEGAGFVCVMARKTYHSPSLKGK